MKKNFYLTLFTLFIVIQHYVSLNPPERGILLSRVSLFISQDSSIVDLEYSNILENYNNKNYDVALKKSLDFIDNYTNSKFDKLNLDYFYEINLIVGDIYKIVNKHSKSILYYKNALGYLDRNNLITESQKTKDDTKLEYVYLKIANEFLRNSQKDSSKKYYDLIIKSTSLNAKILSLQANASSNLSGLYRQDSLYDLAEKYAINALKIHKKNNSVISQASTLGNLASIYLDQNNFKEAKKNYQEALNLIENESSERALKVRENLYFNLAYNLYKLKDYEAYTYQEKSYMIKDSLRNIEIRRMIEELGFKYDFDTEKKLLEKQQELTLLKEREKVKNLLGIGILFLFVFLVIIGFSMMRQKNLKLKLSTTELIQNQKIEKIKSESQIRILNATLDGKETERKEIAEILHDNVSALLSSASLHLQATKNQFNGKTPIEIEKTQQIINETAEKIRNLSHNLISSVLLKFGLNFAISELAEKYTNSELQVSANLNNLKRYQQNFEIKTYNIVQELLNNIIKHSEASNAFIKITDQDNWLYITIADDGIGFDKSIILTKNGLGINQIEARIQVMKGKFDINSKIGSGSKITIELPIQEKEHTKSASPIL